MTPRGPVRYYKIDRGDRVLYLTSPAKKFACYGVDDRDLIMVEESAILAFMEGEDLAPDELDALPMPDRGHHPYDDL